MTKKETELFTAYSIVYGFRDRDNVCFTWFRRNRKRPVLKAGGLSGVGGGKARSYLDRLFTAEEVERLGEYLHRAHDTEIFVQKVGLPVTETALDAIPAGESPVSGGTGFYRLSGEAGYSLPFEVWAYYDLSGAPLTPGARELRAERRAGVLFLRRAMEKLGWSGDVDAELLDALVAELYAESGFQVHLSPKAASPGQDAGEREEGGAAGGTP